MQVELEPLFLEYIPNELEEGILYISREYKTVIHLCVCGCKNKTVTPINKGGWVLTEEDGKVSLSPSIGNYSFPCRSHYVITKNVANFIP